MPPKKKPATTPHYKVGDRVAVTLHTGQLVDATIRAIIERTDVTRYQVDYGQGQDPGSENEPGARATTATT